MGADDAASRVRRVFAVLGMPPEPGGYSIAKFSRSARPYQEWALDLTQEGAERFYKTFYFEYGHASIADLAHLTIVVEDVSMVAAEELWDEPLVDGQASSTRYQDFRKRGVVIPSEIHGAGWAGRYLATCEKLIAFYAEAHARIAKRFAERYADARPPEMPQDKYERTLRARAFDVARYLLPMGVRTGLGQVLSARTLERMLVRLLSHPLQEVREVARELKAAVAERPAFNPTVERLRPVLDALRALLSAHPSDGESKAQGLLKQIERLVGVGARAAPTLLKYAEPSPYLQRVQEALEELAARYGRKLGEEPDGARGVHLHGPQAPLDELACTLLYRALPHSYAQIARFVAGLPRAERARIAALAYEGRGPHDPPVREARVGYSLIFDVCVDCGAWRDFHRHRRLVQIHKPFRPCDAYGYDVPPAVEEAGLAAEYRQHVDEAVALARELERARPWVGQYALPFAYRRRSLFKMDAEELQYIVELRTRPENHFSVREIAFQMFQRFQQRAPELARHIRAVPPEHEEFFKR